MNAAHHPAAFINAIADEGTKAEAVQYLQKTWNELCEARKTIKRLEAQVVSVCDVDGPPVFRQGVPTHEMEDVVTAEDCKGLVKTIKRLQAFKDYVHQRLDEAGVPADPDSPHKAAGCRVGGRLDVALKSYRDLQRRCVDWGAYWRAPDAHGVHLTSEQAVELLRDVLGVEVEIAP